jgi:hypothetical protein
MTGAQIHACAITARKKAIERFDVGRREVADVNIISNCRTIGGIVIGAEDLDRRPFALRSGDDKRRGFGRLMLRRGGLYEVARSWASCLSGAGLPGGGGSVKSGERRRAAAERDHDSLSCEEALSGRQLPLVDG